MAAPACIVLPVREPASSLVGLRRCSEPFDHEVKVLSIASRNPLRVTPAMAADVTGKLWDLADMVAMIDAAAPAPAKRGPYRKRTA